MSIDPVNVLLIEDNPGDARLIREMLSSASNYDPAYRLSQAPDLQAAAEKCATEHFDVALLDMNLPDSDGLPTLQHLNGLFPRLPIVILTGMNDEQMALQFVQHGAQDYITKSECTSQLLRRVIHYAIERKRVEEQLRYLASHDPLTGLPNRVLFYDRLSVALGRTRRDQVGERAKWKGAVMLLDLDNFKTINDSFGHDQGDAILQMSAQRLKACLRESDTVARLGGDEFVVLVAGISDRADCISVAQKILLALQGPLTLEAGPIYLNASIGISIYPDDAEEIETLIKYADTAMYSAKRRRNQICFHQQGDSG